jgi:hypothetical protein
LLLLADGKEEAPVAEEFKIQDLELPGSFVPA